MATLYSNFIKIGPRISLYTPSKPAAGQIIIVFAWLGAAPKHVIKYLTVYQNSAPEACILLIESDVRIVTSSYKAQRAAIKPAVSATLNKLAECGYYGILDKNAVPIGNPSLKAVPMSSLSSSSSSSSSSSIMIKIWPKILLHMFSNGGTNSATQFLIVLREHFGQPLPVIGLLYDSCPAKGTYWKSHNAMALSLRPKDAASRFVSAVVVHCILIVLYTWIACGNDNPATLMRRTLLDDEMLTDSSRGDGSVKGRAYYLFSEADEQVDWMDIKDHAEDARKKGWAVHEVVFEGSGHCAHFLKDGERYAKVMKEMWLGNGK